MSNEEPTKSKFNCPSCGNNVSASPEEVRDPVTCPHCGVTGQFQPVAAAPNAVPPPVVSNAPAPDVVPAPHTRRAAPRRKGTPTPPRRAGARTQKRGRPGYRAHKPVPPPSEGFSLMTVFLIIIAIALSVIIVLIMLPRNLDFIHGYPVGQLDEEKPRNLLFEIQEVIGPRDRLLSYTEAEANAYLNYRINGRQGGPLSPIVKFKGAYADFEKDSAEFYIERTVIGIPFTMSLKVTNKKLRAKTVWQAGGGSIGRFRLSSYQFKPIIDTFIRLGVACEQEMELVKKMGNVRFEDDKIVLDPSFDGSAEPGPPPQKEPASEPASEPEPGADPEAMDAGKGEGEPNMDGKGEPNMDGKGEPDMDGKGEPDMDGKGEPDMDGSKGEPDAKKTDDTKGGPDAENKETSQDAPDG